MFKKNINFNYLLKKLENNEKKSILNFVLNSFFSSKFCIFYFFYIMVFFFLEKRCVFICKDF